MTSDPSTGGSRTLAFVAASVEIAGRKILDDVSFEVRAGEIVGLVGHNGAGKTTLLRAATRVIDLSAGAVTLGSQNIASFSRRTLARALATVPQDIHIAFPFSCLEVVLMGRAPHQPLLGLETQQDLDQARAAMEKLGIGSFAERPIQTLSGGERQLVVFARALVQSSEVLLLDEPTAFLDLRHRIEVLGAVRDHARAGGAALVVSHDLGLAARVCDRLVLLGEGRIVAQGSADEVLTSERLAEAFGIEADILRAADGSPVVVPRLPDRGGA